MLAPLAAVIGTTSIMQQADIQLPLKGRIITQLRLDFAFGMEFDDESGKFSIRINTLFTLKDSAGSATYNPEQTIACGPALGLLHSRVSRADAFNSGCLEITFLDGALLRVDSHKHFEAWEAVGSDGMRVVATPGGGLATWQPNAAAQ
jgi:hypothetical protein